MDPSPAAVAASGKTTSGSPKKSGKAPSPQLPIEEEVTGPSVEVSPTTDPSPPGVSGAPDRGATGTVQSTPSSTGTGMVKGGVCHIRHW
ncbi:hypothetical protein QL285_074485 [Trifolium repens]|nr:hypothetical protein QL285_074485 [Trifolium repens]